MEYIEPSLRESGTNRMNFYGMLGFVIVFAAALLLR